MTFQKFFDDIWRLKKHHALLFKADTFDDVWDWADENEDGLWAEIPAEPIVAIDTKHTEWQAKCLAGELMIDSDLVKGMSRSEVSEKCGVSYDAAKLQLSKI